MSETTTRLDPLTSPVLRTRHGFFTRHGGTSQGPYASLNCSLSGGDDPTHVTENRNRVRQHLGATHLLGVHQVHGAVAITATTAWRPGEGARADALVTATPGLALGVITADCTPILLHDPHARVIAAVHAGWRGAVDGVLEATLDAMQALGATRGNIVAALGPSIRQRSYEVGPDLRETLLAHDALNARFLAPGRPAHWQFDLAGYCAARLAPLAEIHMVAADTFPDDRFWSHRRRTLAGGHLIGHQISAITL